MQRDQIFVCRDASRGVRRAVARYRIEGAKHWTDKASLALAFVANYVGLALFFYGVSEPLPLSRHLVAVVASAAMALLTDTLIDRLLHWIMQQKLRIALKCGDILRFDPSVFAYWQVRLGAKRLREHSAASLTWLEARKYNQLRALYKRTQQPGWQLQDEQQWFEDMLKEFVQTLHPATTPNDSAQDKTVHAE